MNNGKKKKWIIATLIAVGCLLYIALPKFYKENILRTYRIPSPAMMPTMEVGDLFCADMRKDTIEEITRGDIIVFSYPPYPNKTYIKRVIGLPGDNIELRDKILYLNGKAKKEDYVVHTDDRILPANQFPRDNMGPIVVPEHSLFVMGDNRDNSNDSRFWGMVGEDNLKGRAAIIYWSWDKDKYRVRWNRLGKVIK